MVKINAISRSKLEWTKDRSGEVPRAHRSYDAKYNPMAKETEYVRAVRAAKLDRMFAKPFLAAMSGHHDTVQCISLDPLNLSAAVSGGADGEVVVWNTMTKQKRRVFTAHRHCVEGISHTRDGVAFLTASRDKTVKLWDTDLGDDDTAQVTPLSEYLGATCFTSVDHSWSETRFATSGEALEIWDINRTRPIQQFSWGDDTILDCKFNRVEHNLVACCMTDRGVYVYDTRTKNGHSKVIMELTCTSLAWNPMEPHMFVCGSDDWNCYYFDMRVTGRPRSVFQGPIHPISSVDFAPTGASFVAGSQDCTVRIWDVNQVGKLNSREMFHTKRMAKVQSVRWSLDSNYIFSGSEDAIVRVWKADASKPIRALRGPEHTNFNYMRALKEKYSSFDEVKRIANQRNAPKIIRRRQLKARRIMTREMVKEMSRKHADDVKPLAKKKTIQSIK